MTAHANTTIDPPAASPAGRGGCADHVSSGPGWSTSSRATSSIADLARLQGLALALVSEALDHKQLQAAATAIATELALALDCQRVSLGMHSRNRLKAVAISNNAVFDEHANTIRALEDAMEEACHQETAIGFPSPDSRWKTGAHANLSRLTAGGTILTVPMVAGEIVGAIIFERPADVQFNDSNIEFASQIALLIAPLLQLKTRAEHPLRSWLRVSLIKAVSTLVGPRHLIAKVGSVAACMLLMILLLLDGTARVTATAALEPSETHAVVAPLRGYIEGAYHRAGDIVSSGTQLASLDQREIRLERVKWESEMGKLRKEYGAALAARDRAQVRILMSRQNQVRAQIDLLDNLLDRAHLVAPIDGVIVQGDLSEAFGSPVERGQLLFEVAPLDKYRLMLNVDERDIAQIEAGISGRLMLAGKPEEPIDFVVKRILPVAQAENGMNGFRVEADLQADPTWVRPGMVGIAKVDVGERSLAWIYTHRLIDAIRMRIWGWGW